MTPRRVWPAWGLRAPAALALALLVVTCRDATGPHGTGGGRGQVVFAPILPSEAALASFGLAIDQVRIVVVRPQTPPDTLVDTTVALPPDSASLDLDIHVTLLSSPETLSVSIIALSGSTPLFEGTSNVEVTSGSDTPTPTEIPVDNYVGPGAGVDSIDIQPAAPFIYVNDSLRFQVQAFQGGVPVTQFYVSWSTSDSTVADVNGFGVLRAPATRGSVRVRAQTPGGIADSVLATFQPVPTQLVLIAGGGQSGIVGQTLGTPLTVEVRAADGLPVGGAAVRFRAPTGGAPADTTFNADGVGRATVSAVLGSSVGVQTFQINLPAFPAVSLNVGETATSGSISPAQSIITVSSGTVQSGNGVTLTLQGKDGAGNNMTTGGATVVFSVTGGSSTGTIAPSPATDNGNGTYTATFTGVLAGTAATIGATVNGTAVTTTLPTISVTTGAISPATSVVTVSGGTVASGLGVTLTLQAKDAAGNNLATGGATVVFSGSGGTSTGTIGATTDNGNGTYTATFTGVVAGTATSIGATVNATPVGTAPPTVTVTPGVVSAATSVVSVSSGTVASGSAVTLTLQAKDAAGNNLTAGGATVAFAFSGGTSTGIIGALTDNGNGTYTAPFTGATAGTATTISATVNATPVGTAPPTITVGAGTISAATSVVTVSSGTVASGLGVTLTLQAKDAAGNTLATGGATVVFSRSGGTSTGTIGATTDNGNGTYTATFTGVVAGTATNIGATINAAAVTTLAPTITVTPGTISAATSVVSVLSGSVLSGGTVTLTLQAKDASGNNLPAGGATVVFSGAGGTSTGTIGATTDNANGTYTATFTGVVAGTATNIGATINATPVATASPTIVVTPGAISVATSIVSVSSGTVFSGGAVTLTLQAKDAAGNNLAAGGATVAFGFSGGTSTGSIGSTTDNGNGTYTATFTGGTAGSATTITATINATSVATALPTVTVTVGAISAATSVVTVSSGTITSGGSATLTLQAKDAAGNALATGGATVAFSFSGGASTGTIGATTDNGNGTYTATFTGVLAGTATTIGATVNATPVGTALPTIAVTPGAISAATSVVTASSGLISSGAAATLTLQAKDAAGNNLTTGGATIVFTASGGTSTGTIGSTTDNANGTYSTTFTGNVAGTATTIAATVNGTPTTSTTPITVAPGNSAAAQSVITVSTGTVASGSGVTLTLQAKDAAGNPVSTGGSTVVFSFAGGTSTGSIAPSPATDNGNGTYTATFTATVAGTPTTIGATLDGATVTSTLPTVTVTPGVISAATSLVSVSSGTVLSGGTVTLTLQGKDAAGNNLSAGGATVVFSHSGGTSTGTIGGTADNGNGTYTATFTGVSAGTATTIGATVNGSSVATALPTITVDAGAISAATSVVTVSSGTVASGVGVTLTLQAKDAAGNNLGSGGATVVFSASGGTSTGTIGATTDNGNGTYTATFTGVVAGTATTIGATINASPVTTVLPTVTVTTGAVSAATSIVTVSGDSAASGVGVTLTLQAKDAAGNALTTGGATVVFSFAGGTSTGTIGATTDNGNGTYVATFTGVAAGTATTIGATVNASPVTTALPTIVVTPGAISAATSVVTASTATLASGTGATLTLQGKDAAGNVVPTGGATVVFGFSGGTSTGSIGATTDNGNGTYTATFTGLTAGTATTIGATVNGTAVGTTLPTIAVTPGATATVLVTPVVDTVHALGLTRQFTAEARDANGNLVTDTFVWSSSALAIATVNTSGLATAAGNGTATITATSGTTSVFGSAALTVAQVVTAVQVVPSADTIRALGNSRVFAAVAKDAGDSVVAGQTFTWSSSDTLVAKVDTLGLALAIGNGTATITATTAGVSGTATLLVQQVVASVHVTPDSATLVSGLTQQFTAQALDSNTVVVAGASFVWASTNPLLASVDASGLATALAAGIDTITATAGGVTGSARLTVLNAVHAADITADETWAAAGTHIVTGYLRIRNGATLTIGDGATVKFDSAAGLQVGDTALGETGSLVMLGTPGSIHLTANSPTPGPGSWQGIEVQKAIGLQIWRNVDIEYAGGARSNPFHEGCILLVDPAGGAELDSVHIRQCVHAGVRHFAGSLHLHRSQIDSVTGAGVHTEYLTGPPVLRLDSTTIRGSGEEGLVIGNFANLVGATGNRFVGNAVAGVHIFGSQLSGFGLQDSIAGNGFAAGGFGDTIVVDSGTAGYGVPNFTIYRQGAAYLFTGALNVWSSTGVEVTLDSGVVMAFDTTAYMSVGDFADSAGNSSGVSANLVSLGTATSPVVLRNRLGRPGWGGLFLGAQSGTPVLRHMRLVHGGYQPAFGGGGQEVIVKGFFEPLNASLWVDAPLGIAPIVIDSIVSDSSHFHGIVVKRGPPQGIRVRDNLIRQSAGTGLVSRARQYNAADTISGNTITGNFYALDLPADVLPGLGVNSLAGNARDTLLLHGGTLPVSDTLPQLGFRWRVTQSVTVDSGAVFSVLAGDTVVFDPNVFLTIGGAAPSALNAMGTPGAPIVFTADSGLFWGGLEFANVSAAGAASVSNLIVEHAGTALPCGGDCLPIMFAAVRYSNVSTNPVTLDAITVRHSTLTALDVKDSAVSPLTVQNSEFYQNAFSPMIQSPNPLLLAIHGSDLYHYNGQVIKTADTGATELDATGNWWGDAAALYQGFAGGDSLGRAALDSSRVLFDILPGPHFAVGPAAQLTPATDTDLTAAINSVVGDPDSIRARVLDAEGRGVPGTTIAWGASSGVFQDPGLPTDVGGRAGGVWVTDSVANAQFVQATVPGLIGSPVTWTAFLQPGATVSVDFQLLPALTAGVVNGKSVTFTSSGRQGVFVTHAHDQYGNVTQPNSVPDFCFDDPVPTGYCHNQYWYFPQYGIIDSVKADSVFFTVTNATIPLFQIRAQYNGGALGDSILVAMSPYVAGMRIVGDTGYFASLCPVGGPSNSSCQLTFHAELTDSAGGSLPASDVYRFAWSNLLAPDTTVTVDSVFGLMSEWAYVSAHKNGTVPVIAQEILAGGLVPDRDTITMVVQQYASIVKVTPDTQSVGLGDVVTFHALAVDQGGQPVNGGGPIGWRIDPQFTDYFTILFQAGDSAVARIDSVYPNFPRDYDVLLAFSERSLGDTAFGQAIVYNPIALERGGLGSNPTAAAVNPVTNRIYIANRSSASVSVIDGVGDTVVATIPVGVAPSFIAVNPNTNKIYVSNNFDGSVSVIDGATNSVLRTDTIGTTTGAIAVDTAQNLVYVGAMVGSVSTLVRIDGTGDTVRAGEEVVLRGDAAPRGLGIAPAVGRAFVTMVSSFGDTLGVVDLNSRTLVDSIGGLSSGLFGIAVNAANNRVYVGGYGQVSVIDGTPGADTLFTGFFIPVTGYAQGLSVNEVRNKIYVSDAGNTLVREIDGATNSVRYILMGSGEVSMDAAANPANGRVYVPRASGFTVLKYFSN